MTIQERAAKVLREIDADLVLAEKATPGPWAHKQGEYCSHWISREDNLSNIAEIPTSSHYTAPDVSQNAAFIAASRTGWPTALRCLKTAIGAILDGVEVYGASSSWDLQLRRLCDQWDASRK